MKQKSLLVTFLLGVARFTRAVLSLRYKVSIQGMEHLKNATPVLILPNHQAMVDPMIIVSHIYPDTLAIPMVSSTYYDLPLLNKGFKAMGAIRVSDLEAGSRNIHVLEQITEAALSGFKAHRNLVLYPSGQLASQGYERILNKKSGHKIVSEMPDDVTVIGLRITGLWGSMWSKAGTGKTPNFFVMLLKSIFFFLINGIFFMPRRKVNIEIEDLTQEAKEIARGGIKGFNRFLEDFYNLHGEEAPTYVSHFFFRR